MEQNVQVRRTYRDSDAYKRSDRRVLGQPVWPIRRLFDERGVA